MMLSGRTPRVLALSATPLTYSLHGEDDGGAAQLMVFHPRAAKVEHFLARQLCSSLELASGLLGRGAGPSLGLIH
jgi:hypothetical protein